MTTGAFSIGSGNMYALEFFFGMIQMFGKGNNIIQPSIKGSLTFSVISDFVSTLYFKTGFDRFMGDNGRVGVRNHWLDAVHGRSEGWFDALWRNHRQYFTHQIPTIRGAHGYFLVRDRRDIC